MDAVVKVGGSLAEEPKQLIALCTMLSNLAENYQLVMVPGGGKFADVVRELDKLFSLSNTISHRMAIIGMDQFGMLLAQITPNSIATYSLEDAKQLSETKAVPIFLPSRLLLKDNPLRNSWDVTSDSIAAYVANRLQAKKLVLITDVDGIFTEDPKKNETATLIEKIRAIDLMELDLRTSVDKFLAELLLEASFECYIVNGKHPERVKAILAGQKITSTLIPKETE